MSSFNLLVATHMAESSMANRVRRAFALVVCITCLATGGCGNPDRSPASEQREPPATTTPPAPASSPEAGIEAASAAPALAPPVHPGDGVPNSAIKSAPRKDWPCRFVNAIQGATIATQWEYSTPARSHCLIPVDLAGSRGLVGCPDRSVEKNLENQVEMPESYAYDDAGHLVEVTTIATAFRYHWSNDLVVSRTIRGRVAGFATTEHGVEIRDPNGETEVVELDESKRVARYHRGGHTTSFGWKGPRLTRFETFGTTRIEYDCKRPPRR